MSDLINNIVAVIVTYNRCDLLKTTIEKIQGQNEIKCDILVVDNASMDMTKNLITEQFKYSGMHYYNTGINLGGAGGFEYGVKMAVTLGYEYIWMMDDDTWPEPDALKQLFWADNTLGGEWGFLSSVAYWVDGSICKMNIQKKNIFSHIGEKEYNSPISSIKMCSFVSLLVKADTIKEFGLPIGEYFIWTDDYEFTGRISRKRMCYVVPSSKVIHKMKNNRRVEFATEEPSRIDRYHYIYRNDVHCYRQYGLLGWLYILLKIAYTSIHVIFHSENNKNEKLRIIFKGIKEGISFHPNIHYIK